MTLTLTLLDRNGVELNEGDIVKISDGSRIQFWSEIKYLPKEGSVAPFCTFTFHSVIKSEVPENAIKATEPRYNLWYLDDGEEDKAASQHSKYLMDWRECEHQFKMFRLERITKSNQLQLI